MMHDSALVTGGAGFLGSHLCESLLDDGVSVICVDNFSSGSYDNISHLTEDPQFTHLNGDVREMTTYPSVDVIYHLASRASPRDFEEHALDIAITNTTGTRNLLEHARETDATILFASTSEVYGDPEVHPQTESYNGNVNTRGVRGCYDESKRFGETLLMTYQREHNVDTRTARIFNTYGPRMRPDDGRVIPTFIRQALEGEDLTVYGDGSQTRSFCYVDDLIRGLRALGQIKKLSGDVVNIGSTNEITITSLAEIVSDMADTSVDIVHEPLPEDDPQRRQPDIGKARRLLDWEPTVDLESGLERTINYFVTE